MRGFLKTLIRTGGSGPAEFGLVHVVRIFGLLGLTDCSIREINKNTEFVISLHESLLWFDLSKVKDFYMQSFHESIEFLLN